MELVYTPSKHYDAIPLTTSQTIADAAQMEHATITAHIRNHPEEFARCVKYRLSCSEMYDLENQPYYTLNEAQVTTLFSYLRNTSSNQALAKEYDAQFGEVKFELHLRKRHRAECIAARKKCIDLARCNGMSASEIVKYYELAYQCAFDKSKSQYRSDANLFGIKQTVDYMPADDLIKLTNAQEQIIAMLHIGLDYEQMKERLLRPVEASVNSLGGKRRRSFWEFVANKIRPFLECQESNQDCDAA